MKWPEAELSQVAELIMGQSPEGEFYNQAGEGKPLITGSGQMGQIYPRPTQFSSKGAKFSQAGDIIISVRASIGDLNWSDRDYFLGRGVAAIRPRDILDSKYCWWALHAFRHKLDARATGSTFKQIKSEDLAALTFPVPSLEEQRRVVGILDQCEALRTKRHLAVKLTYSLVDALFAKAFGDLRRLCTSSATLA